jgi:hypothetical protein
MIPNCLDIKGSFMLDNISKGLDWFSNLSPVPLLAIGLSATVILFLPTSYADTISLQEFRDSYRSYIGIIFIISWCYLGVQFVWYIKSRVQKWYIGYQKDKIRINRLESLTPEERGYLAPYIQNNINTQRFEVDDGIIGGLETKEIVYRSSNAGDIYGFPYNLQEWAREHLTQHPGLLEGEVPQKKKDYW